MDGFSTNSLRLPPPDYIRRLGIRLTVSSGLIGSGSYVTHAGGVGLQSVIHITGVDLHNADRPEISAAAARHTRRVTNIAYCQTVAISADLFEVPFGSVIADGVVDPGPGLAFEPDAYLEAKSWGQRVADPFPFKIGQPVRR